MYYTKQQVKEPQFTQSQIEWIKGRDKEIFELGATACYETLNPQTGKCDNSLYELRKSGVPPLPEGISDEPVFYKYKHWAYDAVQKGFLIASDKKIQESDFQPLYLRPSPVNGYSLEAHNIVKALAEWSEKYPIDRVYHIAKKDKMDGELIELEKKAKDFISTLPSKDHPAPVVWPDDENIQKFIRIQQSSVNQDGYTLLVVRNAIESTINYLKQRMEGGKQ